MKRSIQTFLFVLCATALLAAQEPAPDTPQTPPSGGSQRGAGTPPATEPQPYDKVITKDAKSKKASSPFTRSRTNAYYEIPKNELDKEFLWNTQIAKTALGVGYGGQMLGTAWSAGS